MSDVLFGGDVSDDSDWGNDEPRGSGGGGSGGGGSVNVASADTPTSLAQGLVGAGAVPALPVNQSTAAEAAEAADAPAAAVAAPAAAAPGGGGLAAVDVAASAAYATATSGTGDAEAEALVVAAADEQGSPGGPGCFYLVGLGLGDEKDITVNGLEVVRRCDRVFLEHYTAVLGVHGTEALAKFYGRPVEVADRTLVEQGSDTILAAAVEGGEVAMLVVGDPFGATTHTDLFLRAHELGLRVQVVHNASIMNAVGCTGLQLYRFGHCVSICFFRDEWRPTSFYEKVAENRKRGLHTLCLLDIKVKEPDFEHLVKTGKERNLPPRFMTVGQCLRQMMEVEGEKQQGAYSLDTLAVGVARVGQHTQCVKSGRISDLLDYDFGAPLHSVVIVGEVDEIEQKMLDHFAVVKQ